MRGNRCVRGGDPLKSRRQRKKDRSERESKSKRGQRLKKKLAEVKTRRDKKQSNGHLAVLMESFVVRRKAVRRAQKKVESVAASKASSVARSEATSQQSAPQQRRRAAPTSRALY